MAVGDGDFASGHDRRVDLVSQFLGSVMDAWSTGFQVFQALADIGTTSLSHPGAAPSGGRGNTTGAVRSKAEEAQAAVAQVADLSPALAQAYMAGAGSALRYYSTMTELLVRYQASVMTAAADRATGRSAASPGDCRVAADDMRAFLREVGDAAKREARCLEDDLSKVSENIARVTARATGSPNPDLSRRRHEMKP